MFSCFKSVSPKVKLSKMKLSCYKPSFLWPFYFVTALAQSVLSHASCTKSKLKPVNVGAGTWQVRPQQLSILTVPLLLPAPDRMEEVCASKSTASPNKVLNLASNDALSLLAPKAFTYCSKSK